MPTLAGNDAAEDGVLISSYNMPARISYGAVDLASNENPYGPSEQAVQRMQDECFNASRYAEDVSEELRALLAAKEGVDPDQIVLGLGGGMILETFVEYLDSVEPLVGGEVVWPMPTYLRLVRKFEHSFGGTSVPIAVNDDMEHDLPAMAAAINERTRVVYVCNPNNPTGTCCDPTELRSFVIEASKQCASTPLVVRSCVSHIPTSVGETRGRDHATAGSSCVPDTARCSWQAPCSSTRPTWSAAQSLRSGR